MKYTALITGASSGIGYRLAKLFAKDGHNLVLVARSEDKLHQVALQFAIKYKIYAKVIAQDLAQPEAPQLIFDELKEEGLQIDILVNNAGFANYGYFRDTDLQKELAMMQVNMLALTHLTKLFLGQVRSDMPARVLNIASTAAFPPGPLMAVYYATKSYVLSFSEALAAEQQGTNVTVTVLCPGATATDFKERANLDGSGIFRDSLLADAKDVAKAGYEGLMAGEVLVFPRVRDKLTAFSVRLFPRKLIRNAVKLIQEKRQ